MCGCVCALLHLCVLPPLPSQSSSAHDRICIISQLHLPDLLCWHTMRLVYLSAYCCCPASQRSTRHLHPPSFSLCTQ